MYIYMQIAQRTNGPFSPNPRGDLEPRSCSGMVEFTQVPNNFIGLNLERNFMSRDTKVIKNNKNTPTTTGPNQVTSSPVVCFPLVCGCVRQKLQVRDEFVSSQTSFVRRK